MNRLTRLLIVVLACVAFSFLFFPIRGSAQILNFYTVNTTSDTVVANACTNGGPGCSLRGAILAANASVGDDDIVVAIPASDPFCSGGVCTINLATALPVITANVSLFGPGADKLTVKPATGVNIRVFTVSNPATVNITRCTISGNPGSPGGGILNFRGTLNVSNSTISGSSGGIEGGGISMFDGGTLNVTNSTISGNSAASGAGIYSFGTLNIINSTITGNTATNGGGIYVVVGGANVTNSTVSSNLASNSSGGIFRGLGAETVNVKNTIIALNSGNGASPDVSGNFVSAGFNLIGKRDGSIGFTAATDQTGTIAAPLNPMLDPAGLRNNGGPTRTIALLSGSPAIDKGTSNGLTGILTTDQRGTGFPRTFDNPAILNAPGGDGTDIGAFERRGNVAADFDGDGKTDIGIFRPPVGEWWYQRSSDGLVPAFQFGASTDRIVPADYTGDGKTDIAFWRPSTGVWFILRSENNSFFSFPFGTNGDIPAPADFDNDGKADPTVFRPSTATWFIQRSSDNGTTIVQFGANGDVPVAADYDGDGRADIAIYRPSLGQWWLNRSTAGVIAMTFGVSTDKPVQGDYTGDGKADVAFWRPSTGEWFILRSENASFFSFPFGIGTDIPAPGDYDGDGRFDATVFRPSQATWFVQRSTAGTLIQQFGANGDRPIPNAFVP